MSEEREDNKYMLRQLICVGVVIGCIIGMIAVPTSRYYSSTARIREARPYMWEVEASTNLIKMAGYFQAALDLLEPFHGQAVWMEAYVPTVDTDFDVIKSNLQQAIDTCNVFAGISPTNTSYQWAVANMKDFAIEMADHLAEQPSQGNSLRFWNTWTQEVSGWFWGLFGIIIGILVLIGVFYHQKNAF